MLIASLNVIFALMFATFAWRAVPRGLQFIKSGWLAIQTHAGKADARQDFENRQTISSGTNFLIAGLGWFVAGIGAWILAILFAYLTLLFMGILV